MVSPAGTITGPSGTACPALPAMISSTAFALASAIGWTTAVSGGWVKRTIGVSSKLTSDRSPGTARPRARAASKVASAMRSLLATIAVGRWAPSRSCAAAARPDS